MGIREKLGYKKAALKTPPTKHAPVKYKEYLAKGRKDNILFFMSNVSKLESGYYLVLFTAIARQCTMYRSHILKNIPNDEEAKQLLAKWAKTIKISAIK